METRRKHPALLRGRKSCVDSHVFLRGSVSRGEQALEMKRQFRRQRPRRYVVRAAEGGKKVVQRFLVHYVDGRNLQAHFIAVAVEKIVVANRKVKQVAGLNTSRIAVGVLRPRRWNLHQSRSKLRAQAGSWQSRRRSRCHAVALESSLELLVSGESA